MNWRGRPLVSHEAVVELIAATTNRSGLTVKAELDHGVYPLGTKITEEQLTAAGVAGHDYHGEWNYDVGPLPTPKPPPTKKAKRANYTAVVLDRNVITL